MGSGYIKVSKINIQSGNKETKFMEIQYIFVQMTIAEMPFCKNSCIPKMSTFGLFEQNGHLQEKLTI